jgi:hypothetical protein
VDLTALVSSAAPRDMVPMGASVRARPLPWLLGLAVALAVTILYHYSLPGESSFDQYRRLAEAFLDGRVYLIDPPEYLEVTRWGGRHYVIPPPLPALLMTPFVAVFGDGASQPLLLGAVAGGLHAMVVLFIVTRMVDRRSDRWWLTVLFTFGTIVWFMAATGSIWFVAHVIAALALSVALLETLGQKRPLVIGVAIAAAFWTRLPSVLTLPFFLVMTVDQWAPYGVRRWRTIRLGYLNALLAPLAVVTLLNFGYNWLRFGTIADVAFRLRNNVPNEWWFHKGSFHVSYIPRHLVTMLWSLPVLRPEFPYVLWSMSGLAIWITTPAFLFAPLAPVLARSTWAAWAGILPTLLALMTFGNTGMVQFGYRFAADFYPILYFLTIRGMGSPLRPIHKIAIVLAVAVNLWGVIWEGMGWRTL